MALMELTDISKSFGAVRAVDRVTVSFDAGEVVALLGDNGAGKSTLVKIMSGVHQPDSGQMRFDGAEVRFRSASEARKAGIETVYQDLALVENLSVVRNFFLAREKRVGPFLAFKQMTSETEMALHEIGLRNLGSVHTEVSYLSGGERQAVAIGRAVYFGRKMLILDEPTAALSVHETNKVIQYIQEAKSRNLSVIVVMHNLHQVRQFADRFVVLWHGIKVADIPNKGQSEEELSALVVYGKPLQSLGV